jgi:hypothetical protein
LSGNGGLSGVEESNFRSYHDSNRIAAQLPVATKEGSMQQVNREFGKLNPKAPSELSRFAFLIGKWRFEAKVKLPGGKSHLFQGTWVGRFILDGHAIADEYRMMDMSGSLVVLGLNLRAYDPNKQTWNIKWLNGLTGTWTDLTPPELGGLCTTADLSSMSSKSWHRSTPHTRILASHTPPMPKPTSLGEVRSRVTGIPGPNSWSLNVIAASSEKEGVGNSASFTASPQTNFPSLLTGRCVRPS